MRGDGRRGDERARRGASGRSGPRSYIVRVGLGGRRRAPTRSRRRRSAARRRAPRPTAASRRWSSRRRTRTGTAPGARGRSWRRRGPGIAGSKRAGDRRRRRRRCESDSSAMRSAMRRLVLARRLSLMTPAGRCVARIRWMPSERPRWAMSTTPSTNSGTSPASAANSSTTITSAGGALRVAALLELEQVLGLLAVEQVLAVVQLGAQARQRAAHEVRAQVGDEADAVRQVDAVGERRAALVVDEEERDAVGAVLGRHAEHPRLQELALAGAGRAADEGVRALRAQVERHRVGAALADDRAQRAGLLQPGRGAAPSGRGWCCSAASARSTTPGAASARSGRAARRNDTCSGCRWSRP